MIVKNRLYRNYLHVAAPTWGHSPSWKSRPLPLRVMLPHLELLRGPPTFAQQKERHCEAPTVFLEATFDSVNQPVALPHSQASHSWQDGQPRFLQRAEGTQASRLVPFQEL